MKFLIFLKKFIYTLYIRRWNQEGQLWRAWSTKREECCTAHLAGEHLGEQSCPRHRQSRLSERAPGEDKPTTLGRAATLLRRLLRPWPPAKRRDCAGSRTKTDVHHRRGGFGQASMQEDLYCCGGSLEQKAARLHRRQFPETLLAAAY